MKIAPRIEAQAALSGLLVMLREINPEIRVLLVSGYSAGDELRQVLESGTIEFLEKPFMLADLAESLTRLMGSR